MKTISVRFLALFVFLPVACRLWQKFICSYNPVVEVAADGKLTATETISVHAEG